MKEGGLAKAHSVLLQLNAVADAPLLRRGALN
jgi:hypothetical protein